MKRKIELLAPGGDVDAAKAAIAAGADAIYCGLDRFNARNRAENISFDDLNGIIRLARTHECEVFLTLNVLIVEQEIPALVNLLNRIVNTRIDGVIVQDLGLFYILLHYFPRLPIHASTQLTTHNEGQIYFLSTLQASRVNLSRELSIQEIQSLTETAHAVDMLTEVFVHGSYCISYSGICYLSSLHGGNSGNRGRCSQPCRDQYVTTASGSDFPLNIKDNSAYFDLKELFNAGVDSVKVEGRIKKFHYLYTAVKSWREQLQKLYSDKPLNSEYGDLHKVFNRGFSNGFLKGNIGKEMFAESPRDYSATHLAQIKGGITDENVEAAKRELYDVKTEIITDVKSQIEKLNADKEPLQITISGKVGTLLEVLVQTSEISFVVHSEINLIANSAPEKGNQSLDAEILLKRFGAFNDTEFFIQTFETSELQDRLFLPFKELTAIKKKALYILNDSQEYLSPIEIPKIKRSSRETIIPKIALLISSQDDLYLSDSTSADIYFQIPDSLGDEFEWYVNLFKENKSVIPWFPSVITADDFHTAVKFLERLQPAKIITNNSGIAHKAARLEISWIAGPYMNSVNSFSLLCLKEQYNCRGAFISNELNRLQIKSIKKPDDFELHYSIFHPIVLMTSRQCLFQQVTGCEKQTIDEQCISECERTATIKNLKDVSLLIKKTKGNHHTVFGDKHCLNTDIISDVPNTFSSFLVDLRSIETDTEVLVSNPKLVGIFENILTGDPEATEVLRQNIRYSTNKQYVKGI